jgi:hypothetical protein
VGHWQAIRLNNFQRPAAAAAALAPLAVPGDDGDDGIDNPFYPEEDLETPSERIPTPDAVPDTIAPDEGESVFDGLFPPVSISAAQTAPATADTESDDDTISFRFE